MNRYVDDRIAFCYPEDLRCTRNRRSAQYYLKRGSLLICIDLPEPESWESLLNHTQRVRQVPRGSVDALGQPIPTHNQWSEEYAAHGFQGRAKSTLAWSRSDELNGKRIDLTLERGEWRLFLIINDNKDFPLNWIDPILGTVAFPGEELYEEARRLGPVARRGPSPYVVSLKVFPKFGRKTPKGRARFDVQYMGATISDQQLQALQHFVDDEKPLYEQAQRAILRYYNERIYPLVSTAIGRYNDLWPACRTIEEVMRLVKLASLMVHEPREDGAVAIGLRFHCSWDDEHGLGLRAVDATIEAVGTDFVALDSRANEWPEFRAT